MKNMNQNDKESKLTHKLKAELKNLIVRLYVNKELLQFFEAKILRATKADRLAMLFYFKKIVQQVHRCPDPDHYTAFEEHYEAEAIAIADEQVSLDPVKWLNAEIEYISNEAVMTKDQVNQQLDMLHEAKQKLSKPWLTKQDVIDMFKISKSTLTRWIARGMPAHKNGKQIYFYLDEINGFLRN